MPAIVCQVWRALMLLSCRWQRCVRSLTLPRPRAPDVPKDSTHVPSCTAPAPSAAIALSPPPGGSGKVPRGRGVRGKRGGGCALCRGGNAELGRRLGSRWRHWEQAATSAACQLDPCMQRPRTWRDLHALWQAQLLRDRWQQRAHHLHREDAMRGRRGRLGWRLRGGAALGAPCSGAAAPPLAHASPLCQLWKHVQNWAATQPFLCLYGTTHLARADELGHACRDAAAAKRLHACFVPAAPRGVQKAGAAGIRGLRRGEGPIVVVASIRAGGRASKQAAGAQAGGRCCARTARALPPRLHAQPARQPKVYVVVRQQHVRQPLPAVWLVALEPQKLGGCTCVCVGGVCGWVGGGGGGGQKRGRAEPRDQLAWLPSLNGQMYCRVSCCNLQPRSPSAARAVARTHCWLLPNPVCKHLLCRTSASAPQPAPRRLHPLCCCLPVTAGTMVVPHSLDSSSASAALSTSHHSLAAVRGTGQAAAAAAACGGFELKGRPRPPFCSQQRCCSVNPPGRMTFLFSSSATIPCCCPLTPSALTRAATSPRSLPAPSSASAMHSLQACSGAVRHTAHGMCWEKRGRGWPAGRAAGAARACAFEAGRTGGQVASTLTVLQCLGRCGAVIMEMEASRRRRTCTHIDGACSACPGRLLVSS